MSVDRITGPLVNDKAQMVSKEKEKNKMKIHNHCTPQARPHGAKIKIYFQFYMPDLSKNLTANFLVSQYS